MAAIVMPPQGWSCHAGHGHGRQGRQTFTDASITARDIPEFELVGEGATTMAVRVQIQEAGTRAVGFPLRLAGSSLCLSQGN